MTDNFKRLEDLLQYNPSKRPSATQALLAKVQKELKEGRDKLAEDQARKTLTEAVSLHEQAQKIKSQFNQQWSKLDKELGKLMNTLEAMNRGQEPGGTEEQQSPEEPSSSG